MENFEFIYNDGEVDITFTIIYLQEKTITVAVSDRGKISVREFDLHQDLNGTYFEYGLYQEKIYVEDFE